jgi:hypothetical protein
VCEEAYQSKVKNVVYENEGKCDLNRTRNDRNVDEASNKRCVPLYRACAGY